MSSLYQIRWLLITCATVALAIGCEQDVLEFPELEPAYVRFVNTTQDVDTLAISIDQAQPVVAVRGGATDYVIAESGRAVGFVLKEGEELLRRDTLFYTLGGAAKVILFTRGATSTVVEFRRAIQDTTLDPDDDPVIRFTHMAEQTDQFVTMELWFKGGEKVYNMEFDPGLSSPYKSLAPGVYSFELREWQSTNVAAELLNVELERGKSYMLFAWDLAPPALDNVGLSIF